MDELKQAWRKKIEANMAKSGWQLDCDAGDLNPVRVWLYSINLTNGPRVVGQISTEFYRDMQSMSGPIQILRSTAEHPGDLLNEALKDYDAQPEGLRNAETRGQLLAFIANYALSTQTWASLPPLSSVPGIHFGAIDWQTAEGKTILRPIAMFGDAPMTPEEIAAGAAMQLEMHLKRFPHEMPVNF